MPPSYGGTRIHAGTPNTLDVLYGTGEVLFTEFAVDFSVLTGTRAYCVLSVVTLYNVSKNPHYYRVRIGGTSGSPGDGDIAATAYWENVTLPNYVRGEGAFTRPSGVEIVKITIDHPTLNSTIAPKAHVHFYSWA